MILYHDLILYFVKCFIMVLFRMIGHCIALICYDKIMYCVLQFCIIEFHLQINKYLKKINTKTLKSIKV